MDVINLLHDQGLALASLRLFILSPKLPGNISDIGYNGKTDKMNNLLITDFVSSTRHSHHQN
jgi:hypothetical protein